MMARTRPINRILAAIWAIALSVVPTGAAAQHPLNLGFERDGIGGPSQPWGWRLLSFAPGATATVDTTIVAEGRRSFRISNDESPVPRAEDPPSHTLMYWIPPLAAVGSGVRLTGRVRAEGPGTRPLVTVQAWGTDGFRGDTARATGGEATGWIPVEGRVRVDSTTHSLVVTVGLAGAGTAWFDDLAVEVDGERLETPPVAPAPDPGGMAWLEERTSTLRRVDPPPGLAPTDDADLEPLIDIVGDARVVSLGESTHGTREFFLGKHRLARFLIERLGFRVFLIEANQLAVEGINEYVHGAPGRAADVMRAMFAVWNTEEVRDLIEWMRAHNAAHPDRAVSFVGFDMQDPSLPVDSLETTLRTLAPALADTVKTLHADYREAWRASPYPQAPEDRRAAWFANAEMAWRLVAEARPRLLAAARRTGDSVAVEWAVQNADIVRQSAESALTQALPTRDSAMASNIEWTLERRFPDARAVVWAHDAHISRGEDGTHDYYGGGSMGGVLARRLGDDYRAIGFLTYRGAYTAYTSGDSREVPLFPAPTGSVEEALHRIAAGRGAAHLLADLRGVEPGEPGTWLLDPRPIRLLGYAAEDWGFAYPIAVGRQFDALLFVDETTPSRRLRR